MAKTVRFLAPKTRLVVRARDQRVARWYETTKELVVTGEVESTCPMTGRPVLTMVEKGYHVWFPANIVRSRVELEEGDTNADMTDHVRPVLFIYDIPDTAVEIVNGKERPFPNPSAALRRFAVRLNLSCWVMQEGDTPHGLIAKMLDAGCDPAIVKFDAEEGKKIIGLAIGKLQKEIADAVVRARESRDRAEAILLASEAGTLEDGRDPAEIEVYYQRRAEQIQERLSALVDDYTAVATRWGINPQVIALDRLDSVKGSIKDEMVARAKAYAAAIRTLKETGESGKAMAAAATAEAVPVEVMADMLRDAGKDTEADAVLAGFGKAPPAPPAEEGDTFSLAGIGTEDEQYENP